MTIWELQGTLVTTNKSPFILFVNVGATGSQRR